jgi:hypothetical protein
MHIPAPNPNLLASESIPTKYYLDTLEATHKILENSRENN